MKHRKIAFAALLCVTLVCGLFLSAYTGSVTEVKGLDSALEKAVRDYLADYVKANLADYQYDQESTQINSPANDGINYTVKGTLGLKNKASGAAASSAFELRVEFINYVGQTTATFRMLEANVGAPR